MIRTILIAEKSNLLLQLPDNFIGQQIEVIAFVVKEAQEKAKSFQKRKTFSAIELDTRNFKFNRDEANER
ncbi:MAG: hypothetical protein AB8G22_09600 [Saprospiraceae bacterium]